MKTSKEIAADWGISERTVLNFCRNGKIKGAYKEGKKWQIPDDAVRPADGSIFLMVFLQVY